MLPAAFVHEGSGAVRFWVLNEAGETLGAIISQQTLRYRFKAREDGSDALATYAAHRDEIDQAVLRRYASGSREPVMLRENDLPRG